MLADVAIIGGTGVGEALSEMGGRPVHVPTRAGQVTGRLLDRPGGSILLIGRHSEGHKVPPHKVNYEALARGLKGCGVSLCFSTAAVGSLRSDWLTGTMAVVSDFVDLTGRHATLFNHSVRHTDFSEPFSERARQLLLRAGAQLGIQLQPEGVYVCENGPRYETPHEIQLLAQIGDVVGMTAASEAVVMREAGIDYACLALVTNLAAGIESAPLSHEEVVAEMLKNSKTIVQLLLEAVDLARAEDRKRK